MTVHNHGSEEGEGLSCAEVELSDGSIRGMCLIKEGLNLSLKKAVLELYYADALEHGEELKYSFMDAPEPPMLASYNMAVESLFFKKNKGN